jgi:predicted nucleic acid-binding protein
VTAYVDSSAFLKLYLDEPEADVAFAVMHEHEIWTTGRHTLIEVRSNLVRLLGGDQLTVARSAFEEDWDRVAVVELDRATCAAAASLAEQTGIRSLDALHLGAAEVAGAVHGLPLISFDRRVRDVAGALGWTVLPT